MDFVPLLILMHAIPLCRCICLLKRWQKEPLKWECQVLWHTTSHLKLFWSVSLCVLLFHCRYISNFRISKNTVSIFMYAGTIFAPDIINLVYFPPIAGCREIVTGLREASGSAALWGLHPWWDNDLRASHPGAGRREGVHHERRGICHRESQGARTEVGSRIQEMTATVCLWTTIQRT